MSERFRPGPALGGLVALVLMTAVAGCGATPTTTPAGTPATAADTAPDIVITAIRAATVGATLSPTP